MTAFDVIIIGAGPGGLNCAKILSQKDLKILILEKNKSTGPKVCAGGLLNHTIDYLKLPEEIIEKRFDEVTFTTARRKKVLKLENRNTLCTIDRKALAQWQMEKLRKKNITLMNGARVTEIKTNHIILNNSQKINFRYLVGADGSNSITRKFLGLAKEKKIIGIQYIIPTDKYQNVEIHFSSALFHSWYAWIFPHNGFVSIGTGGSSNHIPIKLLKKNFHQWLTENNIDFSTGEFQAFPINSDFKGFQFNNLFLIGDAAGLASELSGEGIYQALISGEEAAKKIIDKSYEPVKLKQLLSKHRFHSLTSFSLIKSGKMRNAMFELFMLSLKNRVLGNAGMRYFA